MPWERVGEGGGEIVHCRTAAVPLIMVSRHGDLVTDGELIDQCRQGDRAAFNQLVVRHYAGIFDVARRLLPCSDDAADVAQEVFIAAWKQLPRFQPRAAFRTWLYAITLRQCARSARGARRRPAPLDSLEAAEALPGRMADATSVHGLVERHELETALHAAVHSLPRAQREAIVLHYFGDLTCVETAAVMGISSGAVMTHLFRARQNLRQALRGLVDEESLP
jgi:RNA polymerase sigma-70 factor (ECF subfamily)